MPNETVMPADVAGLIHNMRNWEGDEELDPADLIEDAATALEALSAENERLRKALDVANELEAAGHAVLCGLNARIYAAPASATPVFSGIAVLHDALSRFRTARRAREGGE